MSTASHSSRPPTLHLPSLHLGSFHGLSIESFHSGSLSPSLTPTADPLDQYRDAPSDVAGASGSQPTPIAAAPARELDRTRSKPKGPVPRPQATSTMPPPVAPVSSQTATTSFSPEEGQSTWAPLNVSSGPRQPRRALQPSLTIQTSAPLTPTSDQQKFDLPHIRDSPGIARRRTVIKNSHANQASPVRVTHDTGAWTPPQEEHERVAMPEPHVRPASPRVNSVAQSQSTPSKRSKESTSASGTLQESPSPGMRRTLPRPPGDARPGSRPSSRGNPQPLFTREVTAEPQPMARLPRNSSSPEKAFTFPRPAVAAPEVGFKPATVPAMSLHRQQPSASTMPAIAGLADAGPYPTPSPSRAPIGLGRPSQGPAYIPPEEICLECAMRDRDLADVHVTGEGIWARASDVDWDELKQRERDLVGSDAGSTESTGSRVEGIRVDGGLREVRKRQKDALAAQVGWRGFGWEEGKDGEGLPPGFRGLHGGPLSEDAIRAVMQKFPSSSALRYHRLETYLKHQHRLIVEIRAEAQRVGRYVEPEELKFGSSSGSSHELASVSSSVPSPAGPSRSPLPPVSTVIPRMPSSLSAQSYQPLQRPTTQFIPDREPMLTVPRTPGPRRPSHGKGASSPDVLQRSPRVTYDVGDDPWSLASPAESGLRPFSFAVRAGAVREGGEGSGRRSIFGKFGGSVTSLFGGSHGGSGSMVDMHLALDNDRRNSGVGAHPRAVSMASPSRPSFFGASRPPSSFTEQRSISSSRLAQLSLDDEPKKKGFKGLLAKIKPKPRKPSSSNLAGDYDGDHGPPLHARDANRTPRNQDDALAPPPNMAYLVNRGKRDRSDAASINSDKSVSPQMAYTNMRSVSAPLAGSSGSGSASISPTSSRNIGLRRESYTSGGRPSVDDRRGSAVEMLARDEYAYPQPYQRPHARAKTDSSFSASPALETPPPMHMGMGSGGYFAPNGANGVNGAKGPVSPPRRESMSDGAPLSPNRFKNLPPLPPPRDQSPDYFRATAPAPGAMADPPEFRLRGTLYDDRAKGGGPYPGVSAAYGAYSAYAGAPGSGTQPGQSGQSDHSGQQGPYRSGKGYGSSSALSALGPAFDQPPAGAGGRHVPRASYDPGEHRQRAGPRARGDASPRLAQSMYAQADEYGWDKGRKKQGIKALFAKGH
ncbi:hypothetical protein Q5752_003043 [Cryptotrichosporon argae]